MFLKPVVNATKILLASIVLAAPQSGLSQDEPTRIISDESIEALDEIVVFGEPTLRMLRNEVFKAEEDFYELFNKGRQFDIECFQRRPIGSHIPRRVCEAYFVKNGGIGSLDGTGVLYWSYVRHKRRQMLREMDALVKIHPELHEALMAFGDAKQTFDSALRDRCNNSPLICRRQSQSALSN